MSGRIRRLEKSKSRWLVIAACCAIGLGATFTETIRVEQVTVRGGKGVMFPLVGTLKQGQQLSVLEKQTDGWWRVQVDAKEGYVWAKSLEPPPNGGLLAGLNPSKLNGGRSDPNASSVTASAAAKGIKESTIFYANTNNYKIDGLTEMIEARESVAGNAWFDFLRQGNVGPFK